MKHRIVSISLSALVSANPFASAFCLKPKFISNALSIKKHTRTTPHYHSTSTRMMMSTSTDSEYPGTAVERLNSVRSRVATLSEQDLSGDWSDVRRKVLWAGGLRDLPDAVPGQGYTGHSFNDYNHVDLTTMADNTSDNLNDGEVSIYYNMDQYQFLHKSYVYTYYL